MVLLSIDPGFDRLGIAVIQKEKGSKEILLHSECFTTAAALPHAERLLLVRERITAVIGAFAPEALAIEGLFFSKNTTTALKVAEVRGVILAEAAANSLSIHEYNPMQVKVAVTGYGRAGKAQVMAMVPKIIAVPDGKTSDDELDAIAIGLTAIACERW